MRRVCMFVAVLVVLPACDEGDGNTHTRNATCVRQRTLSASSPGEPPEEWPKYIEVDALDRCTGETYGPLVEEQLAANPDERDDLEARFIALRLVDILTVAEHPAECEALLACATGNMTYTVFGDCLATTGQAEVADEAQNLLGCDGTLPDNTTQPVCAEFVRSAILASVEVCY